tara:strand:- start:1427 stop:2458 length:1032 start_codon:yes stop_codon:yes gene_type:complete
MYKPTPGRSALPKTGRGIPSALPMSPLNKDFPVKPGMKLASYETLFNKADGTQLSKEEATAVLSQKPGTDLSMYEGATNMSQLLGRNNDGSYSPQSSQEAFVGEANVNRRVATNAGKEQNPNTAGFKGQFPRVSSGEVPATATSYTNRGGKTGETRTDKTVKELQGMATNYNVRSGMFGNNINGNYGPELDYQQSQITTNNGNDIFTTGRIGFQRDYVGNPTDSYSEERGSTKRSNYRPRTSNITQQNLNFPTAFTASDIENTVTENPNSLYRQTGSRPTQGGVQAIGGVPVPANRADSYQHLDFAGKLQGANTKSNNAAKRKLRNKGIVPDNTGYYMENTNR